MLCSAEEAARYFGVSRPTVVELLTSHQIRAFRVGDLWRIPRDEMNVYINLNIGDPVGSPVSLILGCKEVAVLLSVSERTIQRLFVSREIRAWQINGKLWRTKREIVDGFIQAKMPPPNQAPQRIIKVA